LGDVTPSVALTIAGSDSGGGAGIQADLRTFAALGIHGTTALAAVTAQSTTAVTAVRTMDPELVVAQIETVLDDLPVAAVKTGMLSSAGNVRAVAGLAARGRLPNLVVDPVLVSSTGHLLLDEGGVGVYRDELLAHALVTTPNLREAAVLTGRSLAQLEDEQAMIEAAEELRRLGPIFVVVKGGHLSAPSSPDVVAGPRGTSLLRAPRVETPNDHGTGCSLSAAIAAQLARGTEPEEAIVAAKRFVHDALARAAGWQLGGGHGPIDHLGWTPVPEQGTTEPGTADG
jgi:hydroxymethylpyrimidine/phosphomethylpyrimidine kinase